jgi:ribosomal protein S18 acetylase RimI-like enzyme
VEHKGKVVAFANFYRFEPMGSFAIGNVIVAPTSRGQGIGLHLIKQMVSVAFSKHQAREVTVSCFNRNVGGLLLYPKLGFHPYAIEERLDQKGERVALIHMRLSRIAP